MLELALIPVGILAGLVFQGIDRKVGARMQHRIGPPILQPLYDVLKLFSKENITPEGTSIFYTLFPVLSLATAITCIPFLFMVSFRGDVLFLIYLLAMITAFMALSGFASSNPFGVVGSWREIVQFMGYEFPFVVAIVAVMADADSLVLSEMASSYHLLPLAFIAFVISCQAKLHRSPFHIPDAETEIVAGIETEFSGARLAILKLAKSTELFILIALTVLLFFGAKDILYFAFYSLVVLFIMITIRIITARLKIDQSFRFFWMFAGPLALIDLIRVVFF